MPEKLGRNMPISCYVSCSALCKALRMDLGDCTGFAATFLENDWVLQFACMHTGFFLDCEGPQTSPETGKYETLILKHSGAWW